MIKFIKLILGLSILLVLLVVIAVVGTLMFFDPNDHKDFIISKAEQNIGRKILLDGKIDMTLYPWLGLEAEAITVGNAKGFGDTPFLKAGKVAMRIKTIPLLKKQYELDTLKLHGVQLNLQKNSEGITNWQDLVKEEKKEKQPFQFAAVALGGVDIRESQVTWQDEQTNQQVSIKDITMTTGELKYGDPVNLAMAFKASANQPALQGDVKMDGILNYDLDTEIYAFKPIELLAVLSGQDVPGGKANLSLKAEMETNLDKETFQLSNLNLDLLDSNIKGGITAEDIKSGKPVSRAQITVQSKDLAKLFQLIDKKAASELARLQDRTVDMKITAASDMGANTLDVSELDMKILGAVIKGDIAASQLDSKQPSAKGKLNAVGPDLPALLQVAGRFAGEKSNLGTYGQKLANVKNKSFDINAEFDMDLAQGAIKVPTFAVKTLGIEAGGQLDGKQIHSDNPNVEGAFALKGEQLNDVLAALGNEDLGNVLQVINIETKVKSEGNEIALSPLQINSTLAGKQIPNSPAEVSLKADTRINPNKQTLAMKNILLSGIGLDLKGQLNASQIKTGKPVVNANLDTSGKDLALLFRLAGMAELADQIASVKDRSFRIKTNLDADMNQGQVKVSDLDAQLVGASVSGAIDARKINTDTPVAKGSLKATGPDLPTLLQIIGKMSGPESGLGETARKLAKAPNKAFDIRTEFDADFKQGNINLPALDINTLGLTIKGNMKSNNLADKSGNIDGQLSLKGEKIDAILSAFGQAPLAEVLETISINAGIKGNTSDIRLSPLDAKAILSGKDIPDSPATVAFKADSRLNLTDQTLSVNDLSLSGLGLNVSGNVKGTKIVDNPELAGKINIGEFNLKKLARQLKQPLPKTADKDVFKKVSLSSGFSGSKDSIKLQALNMQMDESIISGDFSIKHFYQPVIKTTLNVNEINLDRYLPPKETQSQKESKQTSEQAKQADTGDIPVEFLRTLNAEGDIKVGKLIYSNLKLKDIHVGLRAKEGDIRMNPVATNLYQGSYNGSVLLDVREKLPSLQLDSDMKDVQIEPLLKDFTQEKESQLSGIAKVNGQVKAWGHNVDAMKKSSHGQIQFKVKQGILRGIDVRKALEQAEIMIESKRIGKIDKGGETHFDKLSGTMDIKKGIVTNNDLLMTSPGFQLTGEGMIANLHDDSIKYNMKVAVVEETATKGSERYNIGGYDIPIICKGYVTDIKNACAPDYGGLLGVAIKKGALEKLGESLGIEGLEKKKPSSSTSPSEGTTQPAPEKTTQPADPIESITDPEKLLDIFKKKR